MMYAQLSRLLSKTSNIVAKLCYFNNKNVSQTKDMNTWRSL